MEVKLFDAELKVMDVLWEKGDTPAREIARKLTEELGWNVNTTYTLIKRCINKGAIRRSEPGFVCHALIPKPLCRRPKPRSSSTRSTTALPTNCLRPFWAATKFRQSRSAS